VSSSHFPPPPVRRPSVADVGTPEGRAALLALGLRPVLMTDELAAQLADRVFWGEPDERGWYTPSFVGVYGHPRKADA
jgi:hypothetical protein